MSKKTSEIQDAGTGSDADSQNQDADFQTKKQKNTLPVIPNTPVQIRFLLFFWFSFGLVVWTLDRCMLFICKHV